MSAMALNISVSLDLGQGAMPGQRVLTRELSPKEARGNDEPQTAGHPEEQSHRERRATRRLPELCRLPFGVSAMRPREPESRQTKPWPSPGRHLRHPASHSTGNSHAPAAQTWGHNSLTWPCACHTGWRTASSLAHQNSKALDKSRGAESKSGGCARSSQLSLSTALSTIVVPFWAFVHIIWGNALPLTPRRLGFDLDPRLRGRRNAEQHLCQIEPVRRNRLQSQSR